MRIDRATILKKPASIVGTVEVIRSFSYKLNKELYGGPKYESVDFFSSQRASCQIEDAREVSEQLYQFCKSEVLRAAREYVKDMKARLRKEAEEAEATASGIQAFKVGRK